MLTAYSFSRGPHRQLAETVPLHICKQPLLCARNLCCVRVRLPDTMSYALQAVYNQNF